MARPRAPESSTTSTSTVGFPRESSSSRPTTCSMALTLTLPWPLPGEAPTRHATPWGPANWGKATRRTHGARSRRAARGRGGGAPLRGRRRGGRRAARWQTASNRAARPSRGPAAPAPRRPPPAPARRARPTSERRASSNDGWSSPMARALRSSLPTSASAGSALGMPSVIPTRPRSATFSTSQLAMTAPGVLAVTSPNTWGCRATSLSCTAPATSASVKRPSSVARRAWNTTWKRRSPSSSSRCATARASPPGAGAGSTSKRATSAMASTTS